MSAIPDTLFVLIPVHNRRQVTQRCLEQLRDQRYERLVVVVVDDGSTDGTGEMLRTSSGLRVEVVSADGSLWWGGAVAEGMRRIDSLARDTDHVLLLNDDVDLPHDFLARFVAAARQYPDMMLGCVQRDADGRLPDYLGFWIDYQRQVIQTVPASAASGPLTHVDALAGRGLLFGVGLMRAIGYVDAARFPHYWGDIEYSARARDQGFRVACLSDLSLSTSFAPSDSKVQGGGWRKRYFSPVSSRNVAQRLQFWRRRGPLALRRTAALRFAWLQLARAIRRLLGPNPGGTTTW